MMGPPSGGYGDADSFGYDSFGDGASPAVASQYALSTELVGRMQSSVNKCALLEVSEEDGHCWSSMTEAHLAKDHLEVFP